MIQFDIGTRKFQARPLSLFDQMVVAKRLMPVLKGMLKPEVMAVVIAAKRANPDAPLDIVKLSGGDLTGMLHSIADAFYAASDDDLQKIVTVCLKGVAMQQSGGAWAPIMAPSGDMAFDDIGMTESLQIVWKVVEHHLGDFFSTAR